MTNILSFCRRWRAPAPLSLLVAALAAAVPAAAQDEAAAPNVIIDYGALDAAPEATEPAAALPPPAGTPISRLIGGDSGASVEIAPPGEASDETFAAAPTMPIDSTSLEESGAAAESTTVASEAPAEAVAETPVEGMLRVAFAPGSDEIDEPSKSAINGLIEDLAADPWMRVQVLAYAEGDDDEAAAARGISLARALALRRYLGEQGIEFSRMDVRALGNVAQEEPADRVDLIPLQQ